MIFKAPAELTVPLSLYACIPANAGIMGNSKTRPDLIDRSIKEEITTEQARLFLTTISTFQQVSGFDECC